MLAKKQLNTFCFLALTALGACAGDLVATNNGIENQRQEQLGPVSTVEEDGTFKTLIDASSYNNWVYFNFNSPFEPAVAENADSSSDWDLGFKRFNVKLNGGVSGDRDGDLSFADGINLGDAAFDSTRPWTTDIEDGDDDNLDPDYAFSTAGEGWYDYENTVLTAKQRTYWVHDRTGAIIALQFISYYSEAGSAAKISFVWRPLAS